MRASIVATGLMAVFCAGGATAATVITSTQGGGAADGKTQTIILEADKMRMSSDRGGMLYRADTGKMIMINDKTRSYMEFSPDSIQKMRAGMQAQMQQRLAGMPEAQRKKIEAMMAAHGAPGMAGPTPETPRVVAYQRSGDARKVGQWSCTPYTQLVNGKPESDLCVVKMSEVGLTRDDLKGLINLSKTMSQQLAGGQGPAAASADFEALTKAAGYDAFPVQTTHHVGGQMEIESTVLSVEHKDVPAGTFEIPAGYTKHDMMNRMGGSE